MQINFDNYATITVTFDTVADLRAYAASQIVPNLHAVVNGRNSRDDGLGNIFTWAGSSTVADNGSTRIKCAQLDTGRWLALGAGQDGPKGDVGATGDVTPAATAAATVATNAASAASGFAVAAAASAASVGNVAALTAADRAATAANVITTTANAASALASANAINTGVITQAVADTTTAKNAAVAAQNNAVTSANAAAVSYTQTQAIASNAGSLKRYSTYALALAAIAAIAAGEFVEVQADETRAGKITRYHKSGSTLVFDNYIYPNPRSIYVDSAMTNDSGDGLTEVTAKKTLQAACALGTTGDILRLARGSLWYQLTGAIPNFSNFAALRPYGNGPKPRISGAFPVANTWTLIDSATGYYEQNITLPHVLGTGSGGGYAPAAYVVLPTRRVQKSGLTRSLTGTKAQKVAAVKAQASANGIGAFTVYDPASPDADVQASTGIANVTLGVQLADGSSPNSLPNGGYIATVDQSSICYVGNGQDIEGLVFECTGSKDMISTNYSPGNVKAGTVRNCEVLEAATHGGVWGGVNFENHRVEAAYWPTSGGGGGIHQYRGAVSAEPVGKGYYIDGATIVGFISGVYGHTSDGPTLQLQVDLRNITFIRCTNCLQPGPTINVINCDRIKVRDCNNIIANDSNFLITNSDIKLINSPQVFFCYQAKGQIIIDNTTIFVPGTATLLDSAGNGGVNSPTLTIRNGSIVYADGGFAVNSANRNNMNIVLDGTSYLGSIIGATIGTVTAMSGAVYETKDYTLEELRATYGATFDANVLTGTALQSTAKTVAASGGAGDAGADLSWGVVSGGGGGGSSASFNSATGVVGDGTLTMTVSNYASRFIKVANACGAGVFGYYRVNRWILSSGAANVTPVLGTTVASTVTFVGQVYSSAVFNKTMFTDLVCPAISLDGLTLKLAATDVGRLQAGQWVSDLIVGGKSFGPRRIASISADHATLDFAVPWVLNGSIPEYHNIDGGGGGAWALPTATLRYNFGPLYRTINSVVYPRCRVTQYEGPTQEGVFGYQTWAPPSANTTRSPVFLEDAFEWVASTIVKKQRATGAMPLNAINGVIDLGLLLAPGDTFQVDVVSIIEPATMAGNLVNNPAIDGQFVFKRDGYFAQRGIGRKGNA